MRAGHQSSPLALVELSKSNQYGGIGGILQGGVQLRYELAQFGIVCFAYLSMRLDGTLTAWQAQPRARREEGPAPSKLFPS